MALIANRRNKHDRTPLGVLIAYFVILCPAIALAQPPNNLWQNAIEIDLGVGGFATGTIDSEVIDLTGATSQAGEHIHDNAFPKTIWYKFSIPTHRSVSVRVLQPTDVLSSTDAGFVVYYESPSVPNASDLAQFTPMTSIASYSQNTCLEQGTYYIQVIARNEANSPVYVNLIVEGTYQAGTSQWLDRIQNKHNLGLVGHGNNATFSWSCLSIDSPFEYGANLPGDSLEYDKSAWFRFTTPAHIDLFSYALNNGHNGSSYLIRIYEGNIAMAELDSIAPVYEAVNTIISGSSVNNSHHLLCELKGDLVYSVQILGHKDYFNQSTFRIWHLGGETTTGAYPQGAGFNAANTFGTLIPEEGDGLVTERFDHYSCEALLSNDSIVCGTANTPEAVESLPGQYDLTMWFTFSTTAEANATFRSHVRHYNSNNCNYDIYNHSVRMRLFALDGSAECTDINYPEDLYFEGSFSAQGIRTLNCLPAGDYAVQLLGRSRVHDTPYHCNNAQLGRRVTLNLTLQAVPEVTHALTYPGDTDWFNSGDALLHNTLYHADSTRFSCTKTIVPDTSVCDAGIDRAIYRQLIIGDSDGDAVADSGYLVIQNYALNNPLLNQQIKSIFYKGDADQLAQSQGINGWPDQLSGLDPYDGCNMYNAFIQSGNTPFNIKRYCVTPGTYTLVSVGDSTENGALSRPNVRFTKSMQSQFADHQNPENLGDIIAQNLSVNSETDVFTCLDNPADVGGLAPCNGYTKQLYREFYLSQNARVTVTEIGQQNSPNNRMRVYRGRASEVGLENVTLAPYHSNSCYSGWNSSGYTLPNCATIPEGWYTVVSYGFGPNYDNNFEIKEQHTYQNNTVHYSVHRTSRIVVSADTNELPGPFYNRPFKACVAPDTITYNNTNEVYPSSFTTYTLCTERFKLSNDFPYSEIPINGCANTNRLAFYVFTTDDEYYLKISGVGNYQKHLYPLNALTDSLLFPETEPLVVCDSGGNDLEVCRLEAGTYTLVVFAGTNVNCNTQITPVVRVSPVAFSRFDHAAHAYDFGEIPADGTFYGGKVGDVHPTHPDRLPSDDIIYCTTGYATTDPPVPCQGSAYAPVNVDSVNHVYHNEPGTQPANKRRNLWYTFVVQGKGNGTVWVRQRGGNSAAIPGFRVFRSNVDGALPFEDLLALNELDSTVASGLTAVADNVPNWCTNRQAQANFSFIPDVCFPDTLKRRYYVLIDHTEQYLGQLNRQIDVQVRWTPFEDEVVDPKYDFYATANVIGNGEITPPYTETPLEFNTLYSGGWGNLGCATGDEDDAYLFGTCQESHQRSLWWKFTIDEPCFFFAGVQSTGTSPNTLNRHLLREVIPGGSIISPQGEEGLLDMGNGTNANPGNGLPNYSWRRHCLSPGTYYYMVRRCAAFDSSSVRVHTYITERLGNYCDNAVGAAASTFGSYSVSVPVLCQTMGSDFGEDGSNLGCLPGPGGHRSTWFQFTYDGDEAADVLFQLNLGGLSNYGGPGNVRYRLFYGDDCETMIEGQECSVNANINNSIACVTAESGNFYVQVVYPNAATGTIGFTFTVSPNTNPDCNPFNPTMLTADFGNQLNCTGDSLVFSNFSSSGSSLQYAWDFGFPNGLSSEVNPVVAFPLPGNYDVTLSVINPALADTVSIVKNVTFEPGSSPLDLGDDLTLCAGESATIGMFIPLATYAWSTGDQLDEIQVDEEGSYWLDLTLGGCTYSDTVNVTLINLAFDLPSPISLCQGDTAELAFISPSPVNYLWSTGSTDTNTTVTSGGPVWLDITIGNCTASDTVMVNLIDHQLALGNDTTLCAGQSLELTPISAMPLNYTWSNGEQNVPLIAVENGVYSVTADGEGCTSTASIEVTFLNIEVSLGDAPVLCAGAAVSLEPTTNVSNFETLWHNGASNLSYQATEPGWVSVQITSQGCSASDSLLIELTDITFDLGDDPILCSGETLFIEAPLFPGASYLWSTGNSNPEIAVESEGALSLEITLNGCMESDELQVITPALSFSLGDDVVICMNDTLLLSPVLNPEAAITWSTGDTDPSIEVYEPGNYGLTLTLQGCTHTDEINVDVYSFESFIPLEQSTCWNESIHIEVPNLDSVVWMSTSELPLSNSATSFTFSPPSSASYSYTAFDQGCSINGSIEIAVWQPYATVDDPEVFHCVNGGDLPEVSIENTTGTNVFNEIPLTDYSAALLGPGSFIVEYQYLDTNQCHAAIPWQLTIGDTVHVEFTVIPDLCHDSPIIELNEWVNVPGGSFELGYANGLTTLSSTLNPALSSADGMLPGAIDMSYSYSGSNGCVSVIDTTVIIHPFPTASASLPDACIGSSVLLIENSTISNGSIASVLWEVEGMELLEEENTLYVIPTQEGETPYTLTTISDVGCISSSSGSFFAHPLPIIEVTATEACVASPNLLSASDLVGTVEQWQWIVDGQSFAGSEALFVSNDPGLFPFSLVATTAQGCQTIAEGTVVAHPNPDITLAAHDACFGEAVEIEYTNVNDGPVTAGILLEGDLISMADNAIQHTFSTTGEHLIAIEVQNEYGCSSNAESMVMVHPLPEVISEPVFNTPCVGEWLEFQIEASIAPPYSIASHAWSFSNGELSFGAVGSFETTEAGTMHAVVTLQSDAGCTTYIELNDAIEVAPLPHSAFTVSPEQVHISTPVVDVQDQSLNAVNWLYHLGDGNESTAPNFRHTYLQTGTYTVTQTVISEDGCTASSTATINVSGYLVFVPNAFTPNNDGRNERFMPSIYGDDILEYEFLIINRWGEEVFRTNDPTDGWNGNGKDGSTHYAINDVYVWLIRIKGAMGYREEFNGSVTLIR